MAYGHQAVAVRTASAHAWRAAAPPSSVDELADVAGIGECVLARIASRSCQHDFPDVKKLSRRERRGVPERGNYELRSVKRGWARAIATIAINQRSDIEGVWRAEKTASTSRDSAAMSSASRCRVRRRSLWVKA